MKIKCVKCNTRFVSDKAEIHTCPKCGTKHNSDNTPAQRGLGAGASRDGR